MNCLLSSSSISTWGTIKQSVCVEVLRPSQPNGVMSSAVSLPNHTFTGQGGTIKTNTCLYWAIQYLHNGV